MLTIYKASAGSGKTFQLAYQYLLLSLGKKDQTTGKYTLCDLARTPNRHRHILAITFTNKATDEMKERILTSFDNVSRQAEARAKGLANSTEKEDPYVGMLLHDLSCNAEDLSKQCKLALHQALNDYDNMRVSTIDAFFQSVLRVFSREIEMDGDFDVEIDDRQALLTAIDEVLSTFDRLDQKDPQYRRLAPVIRRIMAQYHENGAKVNVFNDNGGLRGALFGYFTDALKEQFKPHLNDVKEYLSDLDSPNTRIQQYREELLKHKALCISDAQASATKLYDTFVRKYQLSNPACAPEYYKNALDFFERIKADMWGSKDLKYYTNCLKGGKGSEIFKKYNRKHLISQADRDVAKKLYIDTMRDIGKYMLEKELCDDIVEALDYLALLGEAIKHLEAYRKTNNLILISDTNDLLDQVINDEEVPFIYERLGVEIEHLLIDEFQDTSAKQWDNLRPLVAEALSHDYDNLVIGDEKQSIYRFRNADSSLLHHKAKASVRHDVILEKGNTPEENTNYRSRELIVRFNNTLFDLAGKNDPYYANVVQSIKNDAEGKNGGGYVKCLLAPEKQFKTDKKDPLTGRPLNIIYEQMAEAIKRQHAAGYPLSEIAILVSANDQGAQIIEYFNALHRDIPIKSDEALYLYSSPAVRRVMSVLRAMQRGDSSTLLEEMKDTKYLSERQMQEVVSRFEYFLTHGDTSAPIDEEGHCPGVGDRLAAIDMAMDYDKKGPDYQAFLAEKKPSTILTLIELIISELDKDSRSREYAYLTALQDQAVEYCMQSSSDLYGFLKLWDETGRYKWALTSAASTEAVNLMTIHKAKGLEFECVHIPRLHWTFKEEAQWIDMRAATPFPPFVNRSLIPPVLRLKVPYTEADSNLPYKAQADEACKAMLSDNLNRAYVAMTRAKSELYIWGQVTDTCNVNSDKKDATTMAQLLYADLLATAEAPTGPNAALKATTKRTTDPVTKSEIIELGTPTVPTKKECADVNADQQPGSTPHRKPNGGMTYEVSTPDDVTTLTRLELGNDPDRAIHRYEHIHIKDPYKRRGIVLHAVLARMHRLDDLQEAFERVTRKLYKVTPKESTQYLELLKKALNSNHAEIKRWFSDTVINERPMYDPTLKKEVNSGSAVGNDQPVDNISHEKGTQAETVNPDPRQRPDRVVMHPDGSVDIVDYKFTHQREDTHLTQIKEYAGMLQRMGYHPINAYLWYILLDDITPLEIN